ncbi:MAG: thioredoxin [Paramuribaculum sp.]|nr:thioredoxin [Paramuribaculum sp.]
MAKHFTDANVHDVIASGKPVVIDFWATWCGPCVRMAPVVDELAAEYEDRVEIGKYNIEEESDLGTQYRIMSIPTILFFKNGEQVKDLRLAGSQTKAKLQENIEKLLAL